MYVHTYMSYFVIGTYLSNILLSLNDCFRFKDRSVVYYYIFLRKRTNEMVTQMPFSMIGLTLHQFQSLFFTGKRAEKIHKTVLKTIPTYT